jgi:1,4-dihydroxy-2-naphthoate octaprenyltransferase
MIGNVASKRTPRGWKLWCLGARPQTLTIAVIPVVVGTALAWAEGAARHWLAGVIALLSAMLIQVGTNLHNDAADFERGNDTRERVGPRRITAAGWATPAQVKRAAAIAFASAFAGGVYLVTIGGWPILIIGFAAIAAGWAYSGGPRPISHTPFGELFVLIFFGVLAVAGSYYLQSGAFPISALAAGVGLGGPAAAVLLVNNYRDLEGDRAAGRRTLAALLGRAGSRHMFCALMLIPFIILPFIASVRPRAWIALLALPRAILLMRQFAEANDPASLNALLVATARTQVSFGVLLAIGVTV